MSCDNPERFRRRMFRGFEVGAGSLLETKVDEGVPCASVMNKPLALPMELRPRVC